MKTRWLVLAAVMAGCGGGGGGDGGGGGGPGPENPPPPEVQGDFFDASKFTDVLLTMSPADWDSILMDSQGNAFRQASMQWTTTVMAAVGVRPSGDSARQPGNLKQSLRIRFDAFAAGQAFQGLQELELNGLANDVSMIRERVALDLYRARMVAPRAVHCRLFVNGEYRGVYLGVEVIDERLVRRSFGDTVGNLYLVRADANDQYLWRGTDATMYVPYPWEPLTHRTDGDHSSLVRFLDVLNNAPADLGTICDIENLLSFFALEAAINNTDGFASDFGPNDHRQYYDPLRTLFGLIAWDLDQTWWDSAATRSIYQNFQGSKLSALLESDPALRSRYKQRIGEVIAAEASPENIAARVDAIYAQIRQAAHDDPFKPYPNEQFDDSAPFIKQFAADRAANLQMQISLP